MVNKSPVREALKAAYSTARNLKARLLMAMATGICTGASLGIVLPFLWEALGIKGPSSGIIAGAFCFASIQFFNLFFGRTIYSAVAAYKSAVEHNARLETAGETAQIIKLRANA